MRAGYGYALLLCLSAIVVVGVRHCCCLCPPLLFVSASPDAICSLEGETSPLFSTRAVDLGRLI